MSDLTPNVQNPRKITDEKLAMLKNAIREFGDLSGIIYNRKSKQLVGGHQRTKLVEPGQTVHITKTYPKPTKTGTVAEGFIEIGGEHFAYREVSWDKHREMAANIAANKGAGEWDMPELTKWMKELASFDADDFDMSLTMFDEDELDPFGVIEVEGYTRTGATGVDEDEIPEKPASRTRPGYIYELGEHRLMCGDSTAPADLAKLFNGEQAELCFTSPPYADQREYNGGKELSTAHLAKFILSAAPMVKFFAVNLGYSRKDGQVLTYWDDYIAEARNAGLAFLSWNIWDRSGMSYTVGQATAMFTIDHEWIFVFGPQPKKLHRTVPNKHAGNQNHGTNRQKDGSLTPVRNQVTHSHRQIGTVLRIDIERDKSVEHPAKFPVALPHAYIEAMTSAGQGVFEPFGGSGTTLIACEKTARTCYIMELDTHYCDVIVERWEKYTGQKAKLTNPNKMPVTTKLRKTPEQSKSSHA